MWYHKFLEGDVPYSLNPGGPNHEELSCLIGISEYFENFYNTVNWTESVYFYKSLMQKNIYQGIDLKM